MLECHIYPSEIAYCVLVGFVVRVIASRVYTPEYILWTSESRVLTGAPSGANQTRKKLGLLSEVVCWALQFTHNQTF